MRCERRRDAGSVRFRRFSALAAVVVVLAVVLAACSGGGSSSSSQKKEKSSGTTATTSGSAQNAATEPVGAEAAIAEYLKGQGYEYVGDCANATLPGDKGKWCSTLKSSDPAAGTETYDVGPVGQAPQKSITLKRRGAAQLTPGYQVGVAAGNVAAPHELTRGELEGDAFITGNLLLDQAAGIGNGLADLPAGSTPGGAGGTGGTGGEGSIGGGIGGSSAYPPEGTLVIDDPTPRVGGEVAFRGSGCAANETLRVSFDGRPNGTISSDPQGLFAGSITIPQGTAPGGHLLTVQGSGCVFTTTITVAGNLAFTGSSSNTGTFVLVGVSAVVVGSVLVAGTRRRRRSRTGPRSVS